MDRSVLNKATSADDTPTPGYLYTDIAKATFSAPDASQQLADYLLKKLERDNPHVKLKVLRIIKHVCEQGKPDFRRAVQKKADVIKSCLQYRGSPDPLKGDAPNKAVRDEADAAVKAVFSSDSSTNAYGMSMDAGRKMQGFGSESGAEDFSTRIGGISGQNFGGGGGGGGSSFGSHQMGGGGVGGQKAFGGGGGMVGFGNPNFDNAPKEQESTYLKQAMSSTFSAVSMMASKVPGMASAMPAPTPEPSTSTYRAPPIGGGGGGYGADSGGGYGSGMKGRWGNDVGGGGGGFSAGGAPRLTTSAGTGEYESRVVSELCAPGGPRVAPSAAALEEFARKCESLDAAAVGDQLRQKLGAIGDQSWQTRLKALHAVEALHSHGLDGIVGHVSQFSSELLFECQEMPQCKQKASKVLHLLGFIDQPEEKASGRARQDGGVAPAAAAPAAAAMDLLDMDDGPPAAPSAPSGLLDGYQPPVAAGGSVDLLDTAASAAAASGTSTSLLGNGVSGGDMLDFGGGAAPASASAPANPPAGSLFGGLSVAGQAPAASPASAAAPSLLAGLEQSPQDSGIGGVSSGSGGLFSSMNLGGSGAAAQAPTAPSQAAPAAPSALPGQFGMGAAAGNAAVPDGASTIHGAMPSNMAAAQAMQANANRTAHLNVFAGGGMGPNPMQMQGMPPMQGMGLGMGGAMQMPGMQGMQPMQGGMGAMQSMQPMQPMQQGGMGTMGQPMGGMPLQGFQGQPAMGGAPMGTSPAYGMPGTNMPPPTGSTGGIYGMQGQAPYTAQPGPAFGGGGGAPSQGGGSAFGFISSGGAATPSPTEQPKQDSAFSFVAEEMKGAGGCRGFSPVAVA